MKETQPIDYDAIIEKRWVEAIGEDWDSIKHMMNCGCHQCMMAAESLNENLYDELQQFKNPPEMDHEEFWLYNLALSNVINRLEAGDE